MQRAVQFGKSADRAFGSQNRAFPFIYNFIDRDEDEWESNKGAATAANLTGIGVTVAAGATVQHAIKLDPDYNFKLLGLRYTTYYVDTVNGFYRWYDIVAGWNLEGDYQTQIGTPLIRFIRVSVSFRPDSRYLYGDQNLDPLNNRAGGLVPLQVNTVQGYDYGWGQIRTPYWLPYWGYIVFEITNTHTVKDLVVGGMAYGMKVRV